MPRNDTWPGGTGLETTNGMDSAGSCDSVVSANSGFSDDSLEHLSAEEKACLMFLEETIESLDTEDDSGLSNDEPDQLPSPGNLTNKLADLSASMSKSNFTNLEKLASKQPFEKNDTNYMQSYLVPTPFVVASRTLCSVPSSKPAIPVEKTGYSSKSQFTSKTNNPPHNQKLTVPPEPLEVNAVILPPTKPRDSSVKTAEGPLPRGPLSYDALVHLRRNASTKKTPLCPTVDHTIDTDKHHQPLKECSKLGNLAKSDKRYSEVHKSKAGPPVVAPKPKIPSNIIKAQSEEFIKRDMSLNVTHATNPQLVRREALQKLGLLKDQEAETEAVAPPAPHKSHSSLDPLCDRKTSGSSSCNTRRSPSFCSSPALTEPKNRNLQSSVSFHQSCRVEQESELVSRHPSRATGLTTAGLERFVSHNTDSTNYHEPQRIPSDKLVKTASTAQPPSDKPSNLVGYTVMVVPGMGLDRKEALRKLGLIKD